MTGKTEDIHQQLNALTLSGFSKLKLPIQIKLRRQEGGKNKRQGERQLGRIREEICEQIKDERSNLHVTLLERYNLQSLHCSRCPLQVWFVSAYLNEARKLVQHCKNGEMGNLVHELVQSSTEKKLWELKLVVNDSTAGDYLAQYIQNARYEADEVAVGSTVEGSDVGGAYPGEQQQQQHHPSPSPSSFQVVNNVVIDIIQNQKYTEYDLHRVLKKHKTDLVPLLMLDKEGFNILHQCVKRSRAAFFKILQAHGMWSELVDQEVPRGGASEFAGCTPKHIAERKRLRRMVREIDRLTTLERSMSDKNAVLRACRSGNLSLVRTMVRSGNTDMKARDSERSNAAHWAAVGGNLDLLKFLVQKQSIRPDLRNDNEETPVHVAVRFGHSHLLQFLVRECGVEPAARDNSGRTPIQMTAENGDIESLSQLLRCGVNVDDCLAVIASEFGRYGYLEHLLRCYSCDPHFKNADGKNCLMVAAEGGHVNIVDFLLQKYDFDLKNVSKQNRNVFHYVALKGHSDVAKVLLQKAEDKSLLPSILDCRDKHEIEQSCSLLRGADRGRPAWHYVHLKRKYIHLFQKCTQAGRVDANRMGTIIESGWGMEPGKDFLKKALEEYKQNSRTSQGVDDLTPTTLAIMKGHEDVAMLFIEAGGNVDMRDCFDQTGMHMSAMRGNLNIALVLEKKGLSLSALDGDGDTPVDVAEENEHPDLVNFFKAAENSPEVQEFADKIPRVQSELSVEALRQKRQSGYDATKHVINTIRQLQIDINILLKELGSGPIHEETANIRSTR